MKKVIAAILSLCVMISFFSGCTNNDGISNKGNNKSSEIQNGEDKFKVFLLVPSTITDRGWSQQAYEGLLLIEEELGAQIDYYETEEPSEIIKYSSEYAEDGYDLIIGHGYQYSEPFLQISRKYPDTIFLTSGGSNITENQTVIESGLEQVTYVAGAIAAHFTKTKKFGCIGGMDIPSVSKTFKAFELGAKSIDPEIQVISTYVGSWDNINAGYEATLSLIDEGADVIYGNANVVGLGVIKAADERGVWVFGQGTDQSNLSPDHMIASIYDNTAVGVLEAARKIKDGNFIPGESAFITMANRAAIGLAWNENLKDTFPPELFDLQNTLERKIIFGDIKVPREAKYRN